MAHFYLDEGLTAARPGELVSIGGAEARHAVTVSRVAVGEVIAIGNGAGLILRGEVTRAERDELEIRVNEAVELPRQAPAIFLAQALAKGGRDELAIQAATELGVDGVIPWAAARCISRWEGAKLAKGHQRWSAIVREASKQSVRAWTPDVLELSTTAQLVRLASESRMLVLDPDATDPISSVQPDGRDLVLLVGPEGGIAPQEIEAFAAAGASVVRLGPQVLRTSTAGPAALAVLNVALARWQ